MQPCGFDHMPKDFPRSRRIAEQIQRELSDIIRLDLNDPRVGMITITDVEVTQDNAHAKVFFTLLGDDAKIDTTARALTHAAGYLRTQLSRKLRLRTVPELQFKYDASVERGARLSQLIDAAVSKSKPEAEE